MKPRPRAIILAFLFLGLFLLSGCGAFGKSTPAALPTVVLDGSAPGKTPAAAAVLPGSAGGVTASGIVVPAQEARLSFSLAGNIETVEVAVGENVTAGQVLVRMRGKEDLQAAIAAAEFEVAQAEKAIDDLNRTAGDARTQALNRISTATEAVRDAQYQLDNFTIPSNQAGLETQEALQVMETRLKERRAAFEPYRYYPSTNDTREDLKEQLDQAQADYNTAVRRLQYETELEVTQAELAQALKEFETWKGGPDPAELSVAEARLKNAEASLNAATAKLNNLELKAPFGGVVVETNVDGSEWVMPGQAILTLADLEHLRIETTDLSERDVPRVEIGQPVTVYVKALSQELTGQVSEIAPLADTLGGDVVYKTTIELDSRLPGLRSGMSVEVQFGTGQ